jgi:signal transduction histidine kinase
LRQNPPQSAEVSEQLAEARKQIEDLVLDIQTLSNRLHSSELEFLGLPAAAAGFCKELSKQKKIEIDYCSDAISKELSSDVALCSFHVLREALQNAVSHSGAQRVEVLLRGGSNELNLTVTDSGVGFDTEEALKGPGLGLIVMRERMKLVGGEISIQSQRGRGTTVQIHVPLRGKN